ncbi:MAG: DedA family protein [Rhizobiales bacterium]|nr:DedA family protein [Hyphomicrobiales bacterium]NRB14465.1 DedA family protein [Hyphomicrobiales bacterium]
MADLTDLPIPLLTFLVAYGDALFPVNFFIPGEPAFLLAGFELGSGKGWNLVFLVFLGAILGDQSSYLIGRLYGTKIFSRFKSPKRRRFIARGRLMIKKYGARFVFTSRFLGPVSWVAQAMAGTYKLNYFRYTLASVSSAIIAISQFIVIGYLSAIGIEIFGLSETWDATILIMTENIILSLLTVLLAMALIWWLQKTIRKFIRQKRLAKLPVDEL